MVPLDRQRGQAGTGGDVDVHAFSRDAASLAFNSFWSPPYDAGAKKRKSRGTHVRLG